MYCNSRGTGTALVPGCCENPALPRDCAVSSAEEHLPYTQEVTGSNPVPRTRPARTARRLGPPVFRPARAVLRTAHVVTPHPPGGAPGLERRLQPARGPQGRRARLSDPRDGAPRPGAPASGRHRRPEGGETHPAPAEQGTRWLGAGLQTGRHGRLGPPVFRPARPAAGRRHAVFGWLSPARGAPPCAIPGTVTMERQIQATSPWKTESSGATARLGQPAGVKGPIINSVTKHTKRLRAWKEKVACAVKAERGGDWCSHHLYAVTLQFCFRERQNPAHEGDLDNYVKPVLDGLAAGSSCRRKSSRQPRHQEV